MSDEYLTRPLSSFTLKLGDNEYFPLICGGMGVDISTADLALELARAGAIGHVSDAMVPFLSDHYYGTKYQNTKLKHFTAELEKPEPEQNRWPVEWVYQAARNYVGQTMDRKRGEGAIFINVMEKLTMGAPQETLRARLAGAMDAGIDGITLSAGLHTGTLAMMQDNPRFRDVKIGIIVSSARALKIFLRSAARVERMPDYIVVEGPLAGGHLGFGDDWREHDLKTIVREVAELLAKDGLSIPVIPAGGIFTGTDAADFILNYGASAVQVATRFTISQECGLPADAKQEYLRASEADVEVNSSSPTGYLMRMLKSSPSLRSNIKPNCEALGYMLDRNAQCSYRDAYAAAPVLADGKKACIKEKMCICFHFMRHSCYTCGHNVYRLKDTTSQLGDNSYVLPPAEAIIRDYLKSTENRVSRYIAPAPAEQLVNA